MTRKNLAKIRACQIRRKFESRENSSMFPNIATNKYPKKIRYVSYFFTRKKHVSRKLTDNQLLMWTDVLRWLYLTRGHRQNAFPTFNLEEFGCQCCNLPSCCDHTMRLKMICPLEKMHMWVGNIKQDGEVSIRPLPSERVHDVWNHEGT